MKTPLFLIILVLLPSLLPAVDEMPHRSGDHFAAEHKVVETPAKTGQAIQTPGEDADQGPQYAFGGQPVHDNQLFATFKADRFEHQWREDGVETFLWDVQGWLGNDYHKLTLESEGEILLADGNQVEEATVELLYSRNIGTFWDFQAGIRHDFEPHPERTFVALGLQGLAPQWFEIDAKAYVSEDGDVSARMEVEYELLLTQRLVLIPRVEAGLSLQDVAGHEQWQGVTDVTLGARLMYHFHRKFAPYVGVSWKRLVGKTANKIDDAGDDISTSAFVAGIRFWF